MVDFTRLILKEFPDVEIDLRMSRSKFTAEAFIKRGLRFALMASFCFTATAFFIFSEQQESMFVLFLILVGVFVVSFGGILFFIINSPKAKIAKLGKKIDQEVLFAGRFLLIRMQSGSPLVSTLEEAGKSKGDLGKYFRELMYEIDTGTPLEDALEVTRKYCPSDKFKRILWQLIIVLKTGADILDSLRETVKTITKEQEIEIKAFGKKLSSILLFYLVVACVLPSLGLTMFVIISAFLNFELGPIVYTGVMVLLAVVQATFIIMVKASRPMVDL